MIKAKLQINQNLNKAQLKELVFLRERYNLTLLAVMEETNKNHASLDLSQVWHETENLTELVDQINDMKKCLDSFMPIRLSVSQNLNENLDVEYTYESNRIEGNQLTLWETGMVLNKGITMGSKHFIYYREAVNHKYAIDYIRDIVINKQEFNTTILLNIQGQILNGIDQDNAGRYRTLRVRISGSKHVCPNPLKVPELMDKYFEFYQKNKDTMHPVELSANMHEKLVSIHPFIDGNGRTARLVMNLILLQNGYPITIIKSDMDKRLEYYNALEQAQTSSQQDNSKFQFLVAQYVKQWMIFHLNMFASDIGDDRKDKGYYFFKKIEPLLINK